MYCSFCGSSLDKGGAQCPRCGRPVPGAPPGAASTKARDDAVLRLLLPVQRSGLAVAAGYAGLLCLLCFPSPLALALGIAALFDLRAHPEKFGRGRAIFAIVMGLVGTGFLVVYLARGMAPFTPGGR